MRDSLLFHGDYNQSPPRWNAFNPGCGPDNTVGYGVKILDLPFLFFKKDLLKASDLLYNISISIILYTMFE